MRNPIPAALLLLAWSALAQDADSLAAFVAETAISEDVRVDAIKDFLLNRIPEFPPPKNVEEWESRAKTRRENYRENLVLRGVPDAWRTHRVRVEWTEDIETPHGYRIRKFRYEALPALWVPALLYEPDTIEGKVPAILNVNGHVGAPGKASEYEQIRCINLAKRGMLALHPEWLACGELVSSDYAHSKLAYLDLAGVSGLSVFHFLLERALDVLMNDPRTDSARVAMTGLSGGGWQTTVFSAIDERIRLIVPNAGHSGVSIRIQNLRNMGDLEQMPVDLLTIADYSHVTALFAPRPALLIYNAQDNCCFTASEALPTVYDPVLPVYKMYGRETDFLFHINEDPGTHNYELDNRKQFYKFISRYFMPPDKRFEDEIPSDDEVLSVEALEVGLPADNATFKSLALSINRSRPQYMRSNAWKDTLKKVTRYASINSAVESLGGINANGVRATALRFGTTFGPFLGLLLEKETDRSVAVVHVSDKPIAEALPEIRALTELHGRVLAVEPLFLGGNQPGGGNAWQYGMALQAAGERLLGIQAAEINSVCGWLIEERGASEIRLIAYGPLSGTAAVVAAALADPPVDRIRLHRGIDKFLQLVQDEVDWNKNQALFCFGLQAAFEHIELLNILSRRGVEVELDRS